MDLKETKWALCQFLRQNMHLKIRLNQYSSRWPFGESTLPHEASTCPRNEVPYLHAKLNPPYVRAAEYSSPVDIQNGLLFFILFDCGFTVTRY